MLCHILEELKKREPSLYQDTNDQAQLDPVARLLSIDSVWKSCSHLLGRPQQVLDVGSGFGYGVVYLALQSISVLGIENVGHKIDQGVRMFDDVGFCLERANTVQIKKEPSIFQGDFTLLQEQNVADLITMFYLSEALIISPETFTVCRQLLRKEGMILLSTQASIDVVRERLKSFPLFFKVNLIEIQGNFEQTVIILTP